MSEPGVGTTDQLRAQRDEDLQAVIDQLNGPNPTWADFNFPPALADDGAS